MATLLKDMKKRPYCNDCGVSVGLEHIEGCDAEQCTKCGIQSLSCDCTSPNSVREKWTGISHEHVLKLCEEHNLYTKWSGGWVPAEMNDPRSQHDLNRGIVLFLKLKRNE